MSQLKLNSAAYLELGFSRQRVFVGEGGALVAHAPLKRAFNKQTPIADLHTDTPFLPQAVCCVHVAVVKAESSVF